MWLRPEVDVRGEDVVLWSELPALELWSYFRVLVSAQQPVILCRSLNLLVP